MHPGFELKPAAGFGKDGYRNFEGCMTTLQMKTYLIIRKFECRRNKRGQSYGMAVSYYQTPEELWGYDHVTGAYKEEAAVSAGRIYQRARELFGKGSRISDADPLSRDRSEAEIDAALRKILR
jgi:hypothetical protein